MLLALALTLPTLYFAWLIARSKAEPLSKAIYILWLGTHLANTINDLDKLGL